MKRVTPPQNSILDQLYQPEGFINLTELFRAVPGNVQVWENVRYSLSRRGVGLSTYSRQPLHVLIPPPSLTPSLDESEEIS